MNQPNFVLAFSFVLSILLFGNTAFTQGRGQHPAAQGLNVTLHLVVGGDDVSGLRELPAGLDPVVRQIRSAYPHKNYRLADTIFARAADNSTIEYKGSSGLMGHDTKRAFLDWSLAGLRRSSNAVSFESVLFRFNARVPVAAAAVQEPDGKTRSIYDYETAAFSLATLSIPENVPTLLGTLSLPNNDTLYLVVSVRSPNP